MPKGLLKIIGFTLIIFTISEASKSKDQQLNFALAKRSLLVREKQFMKDRPMSDDLRTFIERYKRKSREKREKRSEASAQDLYVIENGQVVPLQKVKSYKRSQEENKDETQGFTVVPLIIPLVPQQQSKLVKTRTLTEDGQNPAKQEGTVSTMSQAVSVLSPGSTTVPPPGEEFAENNLQDEEYTNNTKEETQVLQKILQDVEGLMQSKHEGNRKEGVLCNLNGSWISDAAGMRFDICYKDSTRKKFRVHVADRIPPNEDGFLCDGNWTVFGELPFLHSGVVIALAVHERDKHIATFIGECRVCEGTETVTGTWLVGRSSRDCKDQKAAHKILSDVWRREQAHNLRKKHLQQLGYNTSNDD